MKKALLLLLALLPLLSWGQGGLIDSVHNVANGPLVIDSSDHTHRYIITGTFDDWSNRTHVHISAGYHGTVVLRNLDMTTRYGSGAYISAIRVEGQNNCSNLTPVTEVDFILDGHNMVCIDQHLQPCIQVDQGTTVRFSAIDPQNNFSGTLCVVNLAISGGAGIGSVGTAMNYNMGQPLAHSPSLLESSVPTAGGNIIISSGIIHAKGGHACGIGGSNCYTYYNGTILIHGGTVYSEANLNANGMGGAAKHYVYHHDSREDYTPLSAIVILPPAQVTSIGKPDFVFPNELPGKPFGGVATLLCLGDTSQPMVTFRTSDSLPGADIYADFSADTTVAHILERFAHLTQIDPHRVFLGTTGADGLLTLHATFPSAVTFFSDATCLTPGLLGSPYGSLSCNSLTQGGEIVLPRSDVRLSLSLSLPQPLPEGYNVSQAQAECAILTLASQDPSPLSNLQVALASGDHFLPLTLPATNLSQGQSISLPVPLRAGLPTGLYRDLLLIDATHGGSPLGTLRATVEQRVVRCVDTVLCDDPSLTLPSGRVVTASGTYLDTVAHTIAPGSQYHMLCDGTEYSLASPITTDSILAFRVRFTTSEPDTTVVEACDSLLWFDTLLTTSGLHLLPLHSSAASLCDSTEYLLLTLHPSYSLRDSLALCPEELPYNYHGLRFTADSLPGLHTYRFRTRHQCDSTLRLSLRFLSSDTLSEALTLCPEAMPLAYCGATLQRPGDYHFSFTNTHGCDSTHQLSLSLFPRRTTRDTVDIADSLLPHPYQDTLFMPGTPSGYYTFHAPDLHGCDSTHTLLLRILPAAPAPLPPDTLQHGACPLWLPNAFTPSEETNQRFLPKGDELLSYELAVYDRLGRRVYYSVDPAEGWDGTSSGQPLPQGAYTYLLRYTCASQPRNPMKAFGTVTLIR